MSFFVAGAAVVYAGYSIYSAEKSAGETRKAGRRQRQIDELNAQLIEKDANNTEVYGQTEMAAYDPTVSATLGAQRAEMAAADVDLTYGTAQTIQDETILTGTLNKLEIQNQARQKALGLRQQASMVRMGGDARQAEANATASAQQRSGYAQAAQVGMSYYGRK